MNTENDVYVPLSEDRVREITELAEKVSGSIHIIRKVRVKQNRNWEVALILAGSNPRTHESTALMSPEVAAQYQPVSEEEIELDIILFKYPECGSDLNKVIAWGSEAGLKGSNPRELFAVIDQSVDLPNSLGKASSVYIASPIECMHQGKRCVCCCYWTIKSMGSEDQTYGLGLGRADDYEGPAVWFAFHE